MEKDIYTRQLFQKFLEDRHSEEELEELLALFDLETTDRQRLHNFVRDVLSGNSDADNSAVNEAIDAEEIDRVGARVRLKLAEELQGRRSMRKLLSPIAAAAAVLIFVSVAFFLLKPPTDPQSREMWAIDEPIETGNRAILLLGDGQRLHLDENQQGIVVDGEIRYLDGTPLADAERIAEQWLTLQTPEGGTYRLTLPDGTLVWLNAGSSLRYPAQFSSRERMLELDGEAYFDVVQTGTPFRVVSEGQSVEVLGTQFNIYAYSGEAMSHTTLLEGSVAVNPRPGGVDGLGSGNASVLEPGQQALVQSGQLSVRTVETGTFIAWTEGRFTFDGKPFAQIMQELGRWYGFDIQYEGRVPDDRFMGGAFRTDRIATALQFLESSDIRYRLERNEQGRRQLIILSPE